MSLENRDTTTYVGAWNVVLEELLRQYPNAKIVIVNQWHLRTGSSANEGLTREEYYHSVVEMYYEYYHEMDRIYLLDAGDTRISGVDMNNADFRAQYSRNPNDVFHLNRDGMAIMKDAMLPYLWNFATRELEEK
jgi:lysophospholipase L1-like esterase